MKALFTLIIISTLVACSDSDPQQGTLRIATWNIYWLTNHSFNTRDASHYDSLGQYAATMNADVIALQEVENADYARLVLGDAYDYYFSSRPGGNGTQRVGIAVRKAAGVIVTRVEDFVDLDVGSVRYGVDMTLQRNGQSMRLLAVHLKSGCFENKLDSASLAALTGSLLNSCTKLDAQRAVIEDWVDQRATEDIPFLVLGDFNRRFDKEDAYSEAEGFWPAIDDPEISPAEDLHHINADLAPPCWGGRFTEYIDQLVADARAFSLYVTGSFSSWSYGELNYTDYYRVLSDHCAISADFTF